jgi:hypothetical protein
METKTTIEPLFLETCELLAHNKWKQVDLLFDDAQREFQKAWESVYAEFGSHPSEAPNAAKMLIASQPRATGLTLAMARSDSVDLFRRFQRFLEFISRATERMPGYPAVAGIPHVQAGFLYMAATVMALHFESWGIFEKLLTTKFEWYYQSGRAIFSYAFDLPYFFHSEAFGRSAPKLHDFYRKELAEERISRVTGLTSESVLEVYAQAQMMMSLKVAQLRETGESPDIWPDFGRFYAERVIRLLDRAYADREYAMGLLRSFKEEPEVFFSRLNGRLGTIHSIFWSGSPYFYESIGSWNPRESNARR